MVSIAFLPTLVVIILFVLHQTRYPCNLIHDYTCKALLITADDTGEIKTLQVQIARLRRERKIAEANEVQKKLDTLLTQKGRKSTDTNDRLSPSEAIERKEKAAFSDVHTRATASERARIDATVAASTNTLSADRDVPNLIQERIERMKSEQISRMEEIQRSRTDTENTRRSRRSRDESSGSTRKSLLEVRKAALMNRLERSSLSDGDRDNILKEIEEYEKLEKVVEQSVEKMKADYEKARTIDDKDERLTYLNNLREGRKSMKDTENDQRTAAKEKYSEIMSKLTARPEL